MLGICWIYYLLTVASCVFLQNLQALMNECIGHVIGKPHSPVTGLYIGKMLLLQYELLPTSISGVKDLFHCLYSVESLLPGCHGDTKQAQQQ